MSKLPLPGLGEYLREQRHSARLSVRQLAEMAGISNPYLSQIERGLKRPSAEILQQIAKGLSVSAESLYVRAGILEEPAPHPEPAPVVSDLLAAIAADPALTDTQRSVLVEVYTSFVGASAADQESPPAPKRVQATKPAQATKSAKTTRTSPSTSTKTSRSRPADATIAPTQKES